MILLLKRRIQKNKNNKKCFWKDDPSFEKKNTEE